MIPQNTTYLVDASLYIFRAYHSLTPDWSDTDGWPTHAVHGFTHALLNLLEQSRAEQIAVCFDQAFGQTFRNTVYPAYKANREPPTEDLVRQFAHCIRVTEALGMTTVAHANFEADDLIGSLAKKLRAAQRNCVIVSADKDLAQLLGANDRQWDFSKAAPFGPEQVRQKYGVGPELMAQLQALSGDAVDNIPGVRGIGLKTASLLLQHFGSLDALYARLEELPFLRMRGAAAAYQKLKAERAQAYLSLQLTTIHCDAPVPEVPALQRRALNLSAINDLFDELGFGAYLRGRAKALHSRPSVSL